MTRQSEIEQLCRALCKFWGVDPDGIEGNLIEQAPIVPDVGETNWHAFEPLAEALKPELGGRGACEECGLPIAICNALALQRNAIRNFKEGRTESALEFEKDAASEYQRFLDSRTDAEE